MAIAPELGMLFLIAFFVMLIAESLSMFPFRRCDEYCSEEAWKLGDITIEIVKIEKRYNIKPEEIPSQVKKYLFASDNGVKKVLLYSHETWGSCREWKSILLNADGSYISDGEWVDQSSRKNAHKYKIMDLNEFLEKYRGKELIMYVHESPSCNPSKEFSFRVVVRVL